MRVKKGAAVGVAGRHGAKGDVIDRQEIPQAQVVGHVYLGTRPIDFNHVQAPGIDWKQRIEQGLHASLLIRRRKHGAIAYAKGVVERYQAVGGMYQRHKVLHLDVTCTGQQRCVRRQVWIEMT